MARRTSRKRTYSPRFTEPVPVTPGDILYLKCSGPITIKGEDRSDALFKGIGDIRWEREGQLVKVRFDGPITALVPRDARLQLDMDGPVKVRDVTAGVIQVLSMDGPLVLDGGATLHIRDADGPLNIANISGAVRIDEADGPINLKNIGGDITIGNADGPVTVRDCRGNIDVTTDGSAFLVLAGDLSQSVRLRVDGNVAVKTPSTTRMAGSVQADDRLIIELDQQAVNTSDETVILTRPEGDGPVVTVDIEADGDVYIGPNPPAAEASSGFHFMGLGALFGGKRRKKTTVSRTVVTPPPAKASAATSDDLAAEREMILRMVAEGKITAEEGHQLLEALE